MAAFFPVSGNIGVDLNNQSATQLFALGMTVVGNQDTEWVYCQANTSISAKTMVAFSALGSAGMASGLDLLAGLQLATAQITVSVSSFFWAAIRGIGLTVQTTGSCTAVAWNSATGNSAITLAGGFANTGILSQASSSAAISGIVAGIAFTTIPDQTVGTSLAVATISWPSGAAPGL